MSIKQIDGYKVYLGKLLGEGSYGSVYEGLNDKTGEKVAIKLLKKANSTIIIKKFSRRR